MAITNGSNLGLAANGTLGDQHFTQLMAQWRGLDGLVQAHVKSATTVAQPASPTDGDCYIIPTGATGTNWSGQAGKVGRYTSVTPGWEFYTPKSGWRVYAEDTRVYLRYADSQWCADTTTVEDVLYSMTKGGTVKIVCLGDSITYGQDGPSGPQASTTYPSRLQEILREYYQNANITVVNAGVSGNTAAQMLARFDTDVAAQNPDIIIFNAGHNDSREANSVSVATYRANCTAVVNKCGATPCIIMGVTPRDLEQQSANGEGVIMQYREALHDIAKDRNLRYVDAFTRLHQLYESRGVAQGEICPGGVHYSATGYKYLGDIVFLEGFANDRLEIKPGNFRNMHTEGIVTTAAASALAGSLLIDDKNLTITNASVIAYFYVSDFVDCSLVLHTVMDNTQSTTQRMAVSNKDITSYTPVTYYTSPSTISAAIFYMNDCPIPTCKLKPGLNRVLIDATGYAVRLSGLSIIPREAYSYEAISRDSVAGQAQGFFGTAWQAGAQSSRTLLSSILGVGYLPATPGVVEPVCRLAPDPDGVTTKWRIRAYMAASSSFLFGQQSTAGTPDTYAYIYKLTFDGTNALLYVRDVVGTERQAASIAVTTPADVRVDIETTPTSVKFIVNGTTLYTDAVPLSIGTVFARNDSTTTRLAINPPIKRSATGGTAANTAGETWITFADNKLHLIDTSVTERTLTFV